MVKIGDAGCHASVVVNRQPDDLPSIVCKKVAEPPSSQPIEWEEHVLSSGLGDYRIAFCRQLKHLDYEASRLHVRCPVEPLANCKSAGDPHHGHVRASGLEPDNISNLEGTGHA
jgi:hypothetical protein